VTPKYGAPASAPPPAIQHEIAGQSTSRSRSHAPNPVARCALAPTRKTLKWLENGSRADRSNRSRPARAKIRTWERENTIRAPRSHESAQLHASKTRRAPLTLPARTRPVPLAHPAPRTSARAPAPQGSKFRGVGGVAICPQCVIPRQSKRWSWRCLKRVVDVKSQFRLLSVA